MRTFFRNEMCLRHHNMPGPRKALDVLNEIQSRGLPLLYNSDFEPLQSEELCVAHAATYVEGVLAGQLPTGFGAPSAAVATQAAWCASAMVAATRYVLAKPGVAFVPASGFHHASWGNGGGFCTFNGLMIAALTAGVKTLIIDGDGHHGDGTDEIIRRSKTKKVRNCSKLYRDWWYELTEKALREDYELVLYQAGADAHIGDPYGAGYLDDDDWVLRDSFVFGTCLKRQLPLVWCLAGGYNGRKTVELHTTTYKLAWRYAARYPATAAEFETVSQRSHVEPVESAQGKP